MRIIWQVSASYRHGCSVPTVSLFLVVFPLSSNNYQHRCILLTHKFIYHWLIIKNHFMSKCGDRNIASIYVSHVCTSHKIFTDLSMIYMYKIIDYMNMNVLHVCTSYKIFMDLSMIYLYVQDRLYEYWHKIFVDPYMHKMGHIKI